MIENIPREVIKLDPVIIDELNKNLKDRYGYAPTGEPNFRIVWSNDQIEKRNVYQTDEGFDLLSPVVKEQKKYAFIKDRYILERVVPIPSNNELLVDIGYESCWVFQDRFQNYLPPIWSACTFIVDSIYTAINSAGMYKKYNNDKDSPEEKLKTLQGMEKELFGNETDVGDALTHGYGISMAGLDGTSNAATKEKET